jgi:hypothetical protein
LVATIVNRSYSHPHFYRLAPAPDSPLVAALRAKQKGAAAPSWCNGAPGEIRTPDHQVRSLVLYPTELRAHWLLRFSTQRRGGRQSRGGIILISMGGVNSLLRIGLRRHSSQQLSRASNGVTWTSRNTFIPEVLIAATHPM